MANNDYICVYREFFEEFAKSSQMEDCRPMRLNVYNLTIDELVGEVMQSCVNHLVERKCPRSLVVPLTKIVVEEFINEAKKQPEEVNTPLKLNRKTHDKISEVCLRYTDNEKLSNLPGPVHETYYSTHSTKHKRRQMEDRLICLPRFNTLHSIQSNSEAGYYGIFDGHGGVTAACYAVSHLHQFLAESEFYPDDPVRALLQAFEKTENKFNSKNENSGTTALAILHQPMEKKLTVAWVGDSQAMLVDQDSYVMLIDPHKPERTDERKRIEAMGGFVFKVQSVFRVNGGLAISRAIGDQKQKPLISAEPEIRVIDLTGSEHFIVMGCDGLWDVVEPHEVIETVYFEVMKHQGQIDTVGRRLVDLAKENNSTDNISVIVIFLTDPAEICNRSVDVTGHRPKIIHQDGVIMEANFQTNNKSPFSDPGMNGIYETNGNHFNAQNESDEDFGPETDVDAVDDVLTSPKNLNPFAKDCWQKTGDENSEKLIEFARQEPKDIEDEIMKFAEGFAEPEKPADEKQSNEAISNEMRSDNFPVDNSSNPFGIPVTNSVPDASNMFGNFTDENNKYVDEINSKKEEEEEDNFTPSDAVDQSSDLKNDQQIDEVDLMGKPQDQSTEHDLFGFDNNSFTEPKETASCTSLQDNEVSNSKLEEGVEKQMLESPVQKESVPEFSSEFQVNEASPVENIDAQSNEINTTLNKMDAFEDPANAEAVDLISQGLPLDAAGNPPELCSVVDVVEAEKASRDFFELDKSVASKEGEEPSSELLSPSAPALDGELKDETVAESGGEIEDSEDDEWNYIKLESGVHQTVPVDSKASDLVSSSNEFPEIEKPTMNSPLNPEADEFIPVSAMSGNNEYDVNMTPKKAIPQDLTDIIASSPNWNNMNNVSLPEESTFLNEIKSRPSNIFENVGSPQQEDVGEKNNDLNSGLNFMPSEETNKENELVNVSQQELHGLDLATDMTSSFIDPTTMGSENEISKENPQIMDSQLEHSFIEKKEFSANESSPGVLELANVEVPTQLPDLLSPVPVQEDTSPVTPILDVVKSSPVESQPLMSEPVAPEILEPLVPDVQESEVAATIQVTTPLDVEKVDEVPQELLETKETTSSKDAEVAAAAAAAAAVAVAATATVAAAVTATPVENAVETAVESAVENPVESAVETAVESAVEIAVESAVETADESAVESAVETAVVKKDAKKPAPKAASTSATKTAVKPLLNGTKTSAPTKKPTPSTQTAKPPAPGKTVGTTAGPVSKTPAPRLSSSTKTQPKSTTSVSSTLNKAPARPRPISATSTISKAPATAKSTVTTSPTKTTAATTTTTTTATKSATKAPASTLKAKPRLTSATAEKKPTATMNGEAKSTTVKRTEVTTKKTGGTTTTTTTTTTTRVSLSARPTSAPAKPTTPSKTTSTTRTVTAKPRTTVSNTTTSSTLSSATKTAPTARKSTIGADKQAKEVANRLTSKTTTAPKANGIGQKTTATKTRKTATSTATPPKTETHDKTENKAEKILVEKVEIIQSENGAPLIENNTDINIINSIASE